MRGLYLLLALCIIYGSAKAQISDAQLWSRVSLSKKITKSLTGTVEQEVRIDHNYGFLKNVFTEIRVGYRYNKFVKYTLAYRYINRGQVEGGYISGNRLTGDLRLRYKMKPFIFSYRNRMQREYRMEELGVREINYNRNKIAVAFDLDKKFSPYFSFEVYYHMDQAEFDKNRYTLGVDFNLKNRNELTIYYRLQQEYNVNNPENQYIVGIGFGHTLKGRLIKKKKNKPAKNEEKKGEELPKL